MIGYPARLVIAFLSLFLVTLSSQAQVPPTVPALKETPFFAERVARGELPPIGERLPAKPLVVDLEARGRRIGIPGGDVISIVARARDIRYISANGYARLVGYDQDFMLKPDILEAVDNQDERIFTFHIRPGHRWSDGTLFTAEDFRFFWQDVANNPALMPSGPPEFMLVNGKPPRFEVMDPQTVRYSWDEPNPRFLPQLANPLDPFIYRPAHYLKQFHASFTDEAKLNDLARSKKLKSWAGLYNRIDSMNEVNDPNLPTLQPWRLVTPPPANRFYFERNPFYHRVDKAGQQLPYIDRVVFDVAAAGLMAAKANAGEADLLFRGLTMGDIPILKEGEQSKGYHTLLWRNARGSELALYPNLNCSDPIFRKLNRDSRFRRALSLGIDRETLNMALLFGLGAEGNNTVLAGSPLYREEFRTTNAQFKPEEANKLLDEIGLNRVYEDGLRQLPDGRNLEITVELDGDNMLMADGLTLIAEFWRDLGIRLIVKPQDRAILNNRTYSGQTIMSASHGLDNAIPTPIMPPTELAPMWQDNLSWPKWGQYVETGGSSGEPIDIPEAQELVRLYTEWLTTSDKEIQTRAWLRMLMNHAENQWSIGTVSGALHPIVVKDGLANVPQNAFYSWLPTSLIGIYRSDEFFWAIPERRGVPKQ